MRKRTILLKHNPFFSKPITPTANGYRKTLYAMMNGRAIRLLVGLTLTLTTAFQIEHGNGNPLFPAATTVHTPFLRKTQVLQTPTAHNRFLGSKPSPRSVCGMLDGNGNGNGGGEKGVEEIEEEARLKVLENRRRTIREMLKSSESLRNFRINNGG